MTFMTDQPRQTRAVTRGKVQALLKHHGDEPDLDTWLTPADIATKLGKSITYVRTLLTDLEDEGSAERTRDAVNHKTVLWKYTGGDHA